MNLDTSTPTGKLMLNLMGSFANLRGKKHWSGSVRALQRPKQKGSIKGRVPTAQRKAAEVVQLRGQGLRPEASVFRALAPQQALAPIMKPHAKADGPGRALNVALSPRKVVVIEWLDNDAMSFRSSRQGVQSGRFKVPSPSPSGAILRIWCARKPSACATESIRREHCAPRRGWLSLRAKLS
jgi:hypothetical protein